MSTSKLSDRNDWFALWSADKESMLSTMASNLFADIAAGYDPLGRSISRQQLEYDAYRANTLLEYAKLRDMTSEDKNRWCFNDMKRRGVIA